MLLLWPTLKMGDFHMTVRQVGQIAPQIKQHIEQFTSTLDGHDDVVQMLRQKTKDNAAKLENVTNRVRREV